MGTELLLWIRSCYYGYGQGYVIEEPISALQRHIPKNVERGTQTPASTSFNIRENKRNIEWLLKQNLNAFKLIQHRFNLDSTCFNTVETKWGANGFTSLFNKTERILKPMMLKPGLN